jgi:hypothetical protein
MVGGVGGYLLHFTALSKTLWLSQNLCTTAWRNKKKKGVKRGAKAFWRGGDMADREVRDMRGKVFERGSHWYGLVHWGTV